MCVYQTFVDYKDSRRFFVKFRVCSQQKIKRSAAEFAFAALLFYFGLSLVYAGEYQEEGIRKATGSENER